MAIIPNIDSNIRYGLNKGKYLITEKSKRLEDYVYGMLASLRTILNDYPVLMDSNVKNGDTEISFMLNILKMLGVSDDEIFSFLSDILSDNKDGNGFLTIVESAIKSIIITYLKGTYGCSVDPMIPDSLLGDMHGLEEASGNGLKIEIKDIDAFGILSHCPTDETGSLFYFDNSTKNGYSPNNIFSSTDFNAYLWFIINRGSYYDIGEYGSELSGRDKCIWDNRVWKRLIFKNDESLVGDPQYGSSKYDFIHTNCNGTPVALTDKALEKYEILSCEYREGASSDGIMSDYIVVRLNKDRYKVGGLSNKTLFDFNTDYISGLKLFDSKTLVSQIVNAVLGIASTLEINMTFEKMAISEYVKSIIENIQISEDIGSVSDCFFSFSNEEYDEMLNNAEKKYNGRYGKNNGSLNEIYESLYKIEPSENLNEQKSSIYNVFKTVSSVTNPEYGMDHSGYELSVENSIVGKFLNETCAQIVLQIFSPKVMLLFAINDSIMNSDKERSFSGMVSFMRDYIKLIKSVVMKIYELILNWLYDFILSKMTPLTTLFIQKISVENIYYYRMLIEQLTDYYKRASNKINFITKQGFEIDSVTSADISPVEEVQSDASVCRN